MINYEKIIENDFEKEIYENKYMQILEYINQFGFVSFNEIIKRIGGSERRMLRLLDEMCENKDIVYDNSILKFGIYNQNTNFVPQYCSNCNGDRVEIENLFKDKISILNEIWEKKPIPTFYFDQRPVNMRTTLKRVSYLLTRGDLINKKIVLLGDDDLTSLAIALTSIPCEIVALDVDTRLVDYINDVARKYKLNNLQAFYFNALDDISNELKNEFDVLMTDPTPEKIPFTVFMNKAIELTKKTNSIIYTSIYSSAMKKDISLQEVITNMNLLITDIIPEFTEYKAIYSLYSENDINLMKKYNIKYDDRSICFTESLFRMEKTINTKKLSIQYKGEDIFGKATKRVISDNSLDPKHIKRDEEYLNKVGEELKSTSNKIFTSK